MNYQPENPYDSTYAYSPIAAAAEESARAAFIRRTYLNLAGAVLALIAIDAVIFTVMTEEQLLGITRMMSGFNWLIVLGLFMAANFVAHRMAMSATSLSAQYGGLRSPCCGLVDPADSAAGDGRVWCQRSDANPLGRCNHVRCVLGPDDRRVRYQS